MGFVLPSWGIPTTADSIVSSSVHKLKNSLGQIFISQRDIAAYNGTQTARSNLYHAQLQ